jgi:hypothetical protein
MDAASEQFRILYNENFCDCYGSLSIVKVAKSIGLRWDGHVARMAETRRRVLKRPRGRQDDNIKVDLGIMGCGDQRWMELVWSRLLWSALVLAVVNLGPSTPKS